MSARCLVIIVTYNGEKYIDKCLSPLYHKDTRVDLMIIDNASTDNTVKIIKDKYPEVHLVKNKKNLGFGAANNIGFRYAIEHGYDYVYLLNQDASIDVESLKTLMKEADKKPEYAVISPLHVYADKTTMDGSFFFCLSKPMLNDFVMGTNVGKTLYDIRSESIIPAAHWLINIKALKKTGLFHPFFYHYGEDNNLMYRFIYHGFKCGIMPSVIGVHDRQQRKLSPKTEMNIRLQLWKAVASNPNMGLAPRYMKIFLDAFDRFSRFKLRVIPALLKFACSIPRVNKTRKQSRQENLFLQ